MNRGITTVRLYSEDKTGKLRRAFEVIVLGWPRVTRKTMFGCPSYRVDGLLFSFLTSEGIVLTRLDVIARERLTKSVGGRPFKAGNRKVEHWLLIPLLDPEGLLPILPHVRRSYESASMSGS